MNDIQAVIFDLGDTLIYFEAVLQDVLAEADETLFQSLLGKGIVLEKEAFLQEYRARMNAYFEERNSEFIEHTTFYVLGEVLMVFGFTGLPEAVLRSALRDMYTVFEKYWIPEAEAVAVLQALQERGYRLGLVSNAADDEDVQTLVDKAAIRPYFDRIITSAVAGIRKPNPRIFQPLFQDWNLRPEQVAMVGDTLGADILGARNAGMFGIWVTRRADNAGNRAHRDTIFPDVAVAKLSELPDLFDGLRQSGS
jgi:HAD superfamily hydrolase (TIGR01662 family)